MIQENLLIKISLILKDKLKCLVYHTIGLEKLQHVILNILNGHNGFSANYIKKVLLN